jgi:rhodanese-related sulfurtransferase
VLKPVNIQQLRKWLDAGEAVLIDVREPTEHAAERIDCAQSAPLSGLSAGVLAEERGKIAVFHCKSGMRTQTNAARLAASTQGEAYYLAGGIEAWKAAGLPVSKA